MCQWQTFEYVSENNKRKKETRKVGDCADPNCKDSYFNVLNADYHTEEAAKIREEYAKSKEGGSAS